MAPDAVGLFHALLTGLQSLYCISFVPIIILGLLASLVRDSIFPFVSSILLAFAMNAVINTAIEEFDPKNNNSTMQPTITAAATTTSTTKPLTMAPVKTVATGNSTTSTVSSSHTVTDTPAVSVETPQVSTNTRIVPNIPVKVDVYVPNTEPPRKSVNLYKEISGN